MEANEQKQDKPRRRWSWGRVCWYLFLLLLATSALHALFIACGVPDFTFWFSASGWFVLTSLCLLLLWLAAGILLRLVMCRRLREMVLVVGSVLVLCWYYRGFSPPTEYHLRLWCCDAASIYPTWHISPLRRLYYAMTASYVDGRDGLALWVNEIEAGHNYDPILGHGPCRLIFSVYGGCGPHIRDEFTLDLPEDRQASQVAFRFAPDSPALGVIVLVRDEQYELINKYKESPIETAKKHGLTWLPVTPENKGHFLLPLTGGVLHFVPVYYKTETVNPGDPPWQVPIFHLRRLPEETGNLLKIPQKTGKIRKVLNMPHNRLAFVRGICIVGFPLTNYRNV
ncbi:MAG: hypothetical protein J6R92_02115 [Akkermansia sp.]|nr:hypothetical protein [Akkermansia sp.]